MTWKFYSARTGQTLESFLIGVLSMEDAFQIFEKYSVLPPENSEIKKVVDTNIIHSKKNRPKPRQTKKRPAPNHPDRTTTKKKPRKRSR